MRGAAALLFSDGYYWLRFALAGCYLPARLLRLSPAALDLPASFGLTREAFIVFLFAAYLAANYRRFWTPEHFLCKFLLYANVCTAMLLLTARDLRLAAAHAVCCLVIWAQVPRPACADDSALTALSDAEFEALTGPRPSAGPRPDYLFVVFHAEFAETCFYVG